MPPAAAAAPQRRAALRRPCRRDSDYPHASGWDLALHPVSRRRLEIRPRAGRSAAAGAGGELLRPTGLLLFAADGAYPAIARATGAQVRCASPASSSIGNRYWREAFRWRVGSTPSNLPRTQVVHALRAAESQWTSNINWCGYADHADTVSQYDGYTLLRFAHDGTNAVDWGSLANTQNCNRALACTMTWYDGEANPIESDIRFNGAVRWSVRPGAGDNDLQSVAAHEFGHVRQFGHVTDASRGQNTVIMWPYITRGDTSGRKLGRGDALAINAHY